ncbi:hypothetical protein AB0F34_24380, partial [Streptomyces fradiae]
MTTSEIWDGTDPSPGGAWPPGADAAPGTGPAPAGDPSPGTHPRPGTDPAGTPYAPTAAGTVTDLTGGGPAEPAPAAEEALTPAARADQDSAVGRL